MKIRITARLICNIGLGLNTAVFLLFALPANAASRCDAGVSLEWPFKQVSGSAQAIKNPPLKFFADNGPEKPFPGLLPKAYLIADLGSGRIISEKNSRVALPIASITKLMTAVVAFENIPPQKTITIRQPMLEPYGYSSYLAVGRQMSLAQLSYPMLLESSNDAAQVVGEFMGNKKTIQMMNEKAGLFSMNSTYFTDVHGLSSQNVSTAQDLFYLARYIIKNHPKILNISRGAANDLCVAGYSGIKNKNLVYDIPNFIGGKTGYIPESAYNGLFVFDIPAVDGSINKIALIILGAPHLRSGSQNLRQEVVLSLDWLKNDYSKSLHLASKP